MVDFGLNASVESYKGFETFEHMPFFFISVSGKLKVCVRVKFLYFFLALELDV